MKEKPIVIVTEGCSMSSFTIKTIFNLLKLHKYDIYFPAKKLSYINLIKILSTKREWT